MKSYFRLCSGEIAALLTAVGLTRQLDMHVTFLLCVLYAVVQSRE
jgi:hypothetical protein